MYRTAGIGGSHREAISRSVPVCDCTVGPSHLYTWAMVIVHVRKVAGDGVRCTMAPDLLH